MKYSYFLLLLALFNVAFAQQVDYGRIIPDTVRSTMPLEEKLVYLAWENYPRNETFQHEINKSQEKIKQAKLGWVQPLSLQFYYGEPHINNQFESTFFPRYNLGVNVNIGQILQTPSKVRSANEDLAISLNNINTQKHLIRAEVLRRYYNYQLKLELLKIHIQAHDDAYNAYLDITQKFKDGRATLVAYTQSALAHNQAAEQKVKSEMEVKMAKVAVEELIGVRLEEVM